VGWVLEKECKMKIYKFLQHGEWPVLIMAKTEAKAKYALYRYARHMSYDGYDGFLDCMKDFKFAGTISKEEAKTLIDADDCDADFGIHQFERAGK
jgi:hypothetical protein